MKAGALHFAVGGDLTCGVLARTKEMNCLASMAIHLLFFIFLPLIWLILSAILAGGLGFGFGYYAFVLPCQNCKTKCVELTL